MLRSAPIIIFLLLQACIVGAQLDENYVDMQKDKKTAYTFTTIRSIPFVISSRLEESKGEPRSSFFVPNTNILQGAGFSYKWFSFKFSVRTPLTFLQKERFGRSDFWNFNININANRFHGDLQIRRNRGYSDLKQDDYDPNWFAGKDYFHRWDTRAMQISTNSIIFFGTKYSHKAAFQFRGRQKLSAASFLMQGTVRHQRITSDSVLIAPPMADAFGQWGTLKEARSTMVGIMPGIAATVVFGKNWFWSPFLSLGGALQHNRHWTHENRSGRLDFAPILDAKFAFGYNSENFFTGLTGFYEFNFVFMRDLFYMTYYNGISWHIGFRW